MEITKPEKFENEVLNEINDILDIEILKRNTTSEFTEIKKFCEMSFLERCFLNGIIRQSKPIKILELGVAAGGSSAIILNAIKDFDNAKLYSVIGAVILDKDIKDNILDYIFLLTLPWEYLLSDIDILQCHKLFLKNYGKEIAEIFLGIIFLNKELFIKNKNAEISNINNNVYNEINSIKIKYDNLEKDLSDIINSYKNLINTMAWWIPVRKWRDNFRNKFFDKFIGGR